MNTRVPSRLEHLLHSATETLIYPLEDGWRRRTSTVSKKINHKEIRVVGMRRTGNHALLTWIEHQISGDVYHLNNVRAGANPYRYKANNLLRYHPEHRKMAQAYRRQAKGELVERDCLLYSYEDWGLPQITHPRFERNRELYLGRATECFDVLILRDPFNLFASRLKKGYVPTKDRNRSMVDMWLEYAREFLRESQFLTRNVICINYNRWFADKNYRHQLANRLGLPFSDAGLTVVPNLGGGSSFEGTQLNRQAREMDVTNRWQQFAKEPAFRQIFENAAIWHYSQRIFGEIPGTEKLRTNVL